jgi:hypothetical protein
MPAVAGRQLTEGARALLEAGDTLLLLDGHHEHWKEALAALRAA